MKVVQPHSHRPKHHCKYPRCSERNTSKAWVDIAHRCSTAPPSKCGVYKHNYTLLPVKIWSLHAKLPMTWFSVDPKAFKKSPNINHHLQRSVFDWLLSYVAEMHPPPVIRFDAKTQVIPISLRFVTNTSSYCVFSCWTRRELQGCEFIKFTGHASLVSTQKASKNWDFDDITWHQKNWMSGWTWIFSHWCPLWSVSSHFIALLPLSHMRELHGAWPKSPFHRLLTIYSSATKLESCCWTLVVTDVLFAWFALFSWMTKHWSRDDLPGSSWIYIVWVWSPRTCAFHQGISSDQLCHMFFSLTGAHSSEKNNAG